MGLFEEISDDAKKARIIDLCLKSDPLAHEELEALEKWTVARDDGTAYSPVEEVLRTKAILSDSSIASEEKAALEAQLIDERKKLEGISPAELPEFSDKKPSPELTNTLKACAAATILESYKLYRDFIEQKDPNALLHSNNPMIRRGIGFALHEMASQAANGLLTNQTLVFTPRNIINEALEGVSRGASETVINNLIPTQYQATAKLIAQGSVRALFNSFTKDLGFPNWLVSAFGTSIAGILSNSVANNLVAMNINDKKKIQEYVDFINTVIIKTTVQGLSSRSFKTAMYTLLTAFAKDATFKAAGGVEALKNRDIPGLMQGALSLGAMKKIIDACTSMFSDSKLTPITNLKEAHDYLGLLNLGTNLYRFIGDANAENAQALYSNANHLISANYGLTYIPVALTALEVVGKVYQKKYKEAGISAITNIAYMAGPTIRETGNYQIVLAYNAVVSAYSGYQLLSSLISNLKAPSDQESINKNMKNAIAQVEVQNPEIPILQINRALSPFSSSAYRKKAVTRR